MVLNGPASRRAARSDPELAVDRAEMGMDRSQTDDEPLYNECVAHPVCHQTEDLDLARGQPGIVCLDSAVDTDRYRAFFVRGCEPDCDGDASREVFGEVEIGFRERVAAFLVDRHDHSDRLVPGE